MSSNRLVFEGMNEFRAALRQLPVHLRDDGAEIVETAVDWAHNEIGAKYREHEVTGNLAKHLKVEVKKTAFGTAAMLKSTANHAHLFEDGSAVRKNKKGANRGSMPPANVFVPVVVRKRRWMYDQLIALLERAGLSVSGAP